MPSPLVFAIAGICVYLFTWLLIRLATSTKSFSEQPPEDQARAKKQFKYALIFLPVCLVGVYLLVHAPPSVLRWLPLVLYLALWVFSFWLLWRSYRLGIKKEFSLVKGISGKPLSNPERFATILAVAWLMVSLAVAAVLVAIPVFRLPLSTWAPLITIITSCYALVANWCERKAAAANPSLQRTAFGSR